MDAVRVTPRLKKAEALHDYVVRLTYADGLTAEVDLGYVVELGPVFEELRRPEVFRGLRASLARQAAAVTP
jgi:hypothetical protein